MGHFHKAGRAADIALGKLHCVEIEGRRIALFSLGEEIYALGDLCTQECPIIEARTDREVIVCPLHEARFTARTNASVDTIERYNVRVQDGDVEIEIS